MRKATYWEPESGSWRTRLRVQREKGNDLGVDALKEMLAEQKGRISGGAEVEGLKLKLSNTETEL